MKILETLALFGIELWFRVGLSGWDWCIFGIGILMNSWGLVVGV